MAIDHCDTSFYTVVCTIMQPMGDKDRKTLFGRQMFVQVQVLFIFQECPLAECE